MDTRNTSYIVIDGRGNSYGLKGSNRASKQAHADTLNRRGHNGATWTVAVTR